MLMASSLVLGACDRETGGNDAGFHGFVGTFEGADMTITIQAGGAAGTVNGTIRRGEQSFPLMAKLVPQGIRGTFESDGHDFAFDATLEDGKSLVFNTEGTTYTLARQGGAAAPDTAANPFASGGSETGPALPRDNESGAIAATNGRGSAPLPDDETVSSAATLRGGGAYQFPSGLSFRYPRGWTVQEVAGGDVMLIPPNASLQLEGYQVFIPQFNEALAQAGMRGDDPRLAEVVDALIQRLGANLRRVKGPEAVTSGGQPGAVYTYDGTGANGRPARARVRIAIHDSSLTGILAIAEPDTLAARDRAIQVVFESFSIGGAGIDPALVGTWMGNLRDNGRFIEGVGRSPTVTASDSRTRYVLSADGTLTSITRSRFMASTRDVFIDTGDSEETETGRWSAANGRLSLTLDGSTGSFPYRIQGNTLILTRPDGSASTAIRVQ